MSFGLNVKCVCSEPTVYIDFFLIDLYSLVIVVYRGFAKNRFMSHALNRLPLWGYYLDFTSFWCF